MSCKNCFPNCVPLSDQCVKYTGDSNTILDICKGDSLASVQEAIITKLLSALDGTGVTPKDISFDDAEWVEDELGVLPPSLNNLLQVLINSQQVLKNLVDDLGTTDTPFVFDIKCLPLTTSSTRDEILQATVTLLCSLNTSFSLISTTYVKLSDFTSKVQEVIASNQVGGVAQHYNKMIPYVALPYFGPLSNFDSTGEGVTAAGFEKIYICNGLNGTPDMRGRTPVGAVRNVPGGPFDAAVDPNNPINPNTNYSLNDKFGENYHKLTTTEIPSHTHGLNDPGHQHDYTFGNDTTSGNNNSGFMKWNSDGQSKKVQKATTGITLSSVGGGESHNNIQPSIATIFIMYIP